MFTLRDFRLAWLLIAAAACWGFATAVSKSALSAFDPLVLLVVQLTSSSAFVAVALLIRREAVPHTGQTTKLALLGVLNPGLAYALSLAGLTTISASLSVLLWAGEPLLILILAVLVLEEPITATTARSRSSWSSSSPPSVSPSSWPPGSRPRATSPRPRPSPRRHG